MRSFADRWIRDRWKALREASRLKPIYPEEFSHELDRLLGYQERHQREEASRRLKQQYAYAYEQWKKFTDAYAEELKANREDHIRTYLARTIYGITIALIILGTSWLAKIWDIPLPLRPLLSP